MFVLISGALRVFSYMMMADARTSGPVGSVVSDSAAQSVRGRTARDGFMEHRTTIHQVQHR